MDTKESNKMRVLMLPWLAHGHISPFLELAKKLTTRNFTIYICSTPINLSSIQNRITQQQSLSIKLVELHLPPSPDLPPHRHTTNGLPPHLMPALKSAYKTAATPQFSAVVKTLSPHLLIHDFNQPWAAAIAAEHGVPAVQLITTSAAFASSIVHRFKRPGIEYPFPEIQLRGFHDAQLRQMLDQAKDSREANHESRPLETTEKKSCGIVLYNTFRELEGKYIDYLDSLSETKIVPVGPIIQEVVDGTEETEVLNWLDKKKISSTVFVSFGSEYFLSKEELEEVAHGLEISGVNFIWVIRFPLGEETATEEALPKGFLDRVGERGMVVEGWAPQARILAHSSVGGFVSHCGWNSVLESLKFGVPIIAMPMQLDQPSNARLMEEVGVGVEVGREEDGRLDRHEIAKTIRKIVVEKNGEGIRVKSREMSETIKLREEKGVDELVEEFARHCMERN